jgi:ribonuclease R
LAARAANRKNRCPTRDELLDFLRKRDEPASIAELARLFGVKGKERSALRILLRELEGDGLIDAPARRKYASRQKLGSVAVLEIIGPDADGELRARPLRWAKGEEAPTIYVSPDRGRGRAPGAGERILARLKPDADGGFNAQIMRRLGTTAVEIIGVYEQTATGGRILPTDKRAKYDYAVRAAQRKGAEPGDLVRARVMAERSGRLRQAEVIERIGHMDSPGAIGILALHSNDIPIDFPPAALSEAEAAAPPTLEGREDLRGVPLVTIDGEDARDFDDAVFAEPDTDPANRGGWRLIVAIADVAWYVRPESALDEAARQRGNSVYLPGQVVPMLPEALSAGLCSLRPGEERAVLAAHMRIDRMGKMIDHRFCRGLMRSAARLTYRQIQGIKDNGKGACPDGLSPKMLDNLYGAHAALAEERAVRGTLELDLPEFGVDLSKAGGVEKISRRERLMSHRLIEEFMITANVAAAETLEHHRTPCIYRVHEPPDTEKLAGLRDFLETFGFHLPPGQVTRAKQLAALLEKSANDPSAEVIHGAILRCQSQADYRPVNRGHFGLALRRYAHFTSPIRRYADLLVHRALIAALDLGPGGLGANGGDAFEEISVHISDTERRAQSAEREAMDRYLALYLEERLGSRFQGRITGVTRFGLFVRLADFGADGLVPIRLLGDERWHHDEQRHCLEGMASGKLYTLGDDVEVELREANAKTGGLVFIISAHRPVKRHGKASAKRTSRSQPRQHRRGRGPKKNRKSRKKS